MPSKSKTKSKPAPKAATARPAAKAVKAKPAAKAAAVKVAKAKPAAPAKTARPVKAGKTDAKLKAMVKKKLPAPANGRTSSVRRTRGKEIAKRPGGFASRPLVRPDIKREIWTPGPEMPPAVFARKQKTRLLELRDSMVDSMNGVASETLRARAEGSEASAFGMHQADAGSDAYDRDFALSLLSKEQDALYEVDEALKRLDAGTYGVCEMCQKKIPQSRLEAVPFARFTVECQQEYEREVALNGGRRPLRSLFGLMGSEDDEEDGEEETVEKSDD